MAKGKGSGLPEGFSIGASKEDLADEPVQLGDYLEETLTPRRPPATRTQQVQPEPVSEPVVTGPEPQLANREHQPTAQSHQAPLREQPAPQLFETQPSAVAPPMLPVRQKKQVRLQINLMVDGKNAHDNLMRFIQERSRQPDVKTAEVYQALAFAICNALPYLDLKGVPERGAWGSPTARSFITSLQGAFERAIGERYAAEQRQS